MNFSKTGQNLSLDRKKTNLLDAVYYTLESISFENDHQKKTPTQQRYSQQFAENAIKLLFYVVDKGVAVVLVHIRY